MCVPQSVGGDGHDAFGTLLRGKPRGVLQGLVRQRRQMEARLVRVAEPGAAGHGQHLKQEKHKDSRLPQSVPWQSWGYCTLPCRKVKSMQMWLFGRFVANHCLLFNHSIYKYPTQDKMCAELQQKINQFSEFVDSSNIFFSFCFNKNLQKCKFLLWTGFIFRPGSTVWLRDTECVCCRCETYGFLSLHPDSEELDWSRTQVAGSRIR